ncbi:hypothetical protein PGT21_031190 [Puccinia graminis f. sp. tritici]|nr:hypothetical protein PGT21_031085 [Puccinia graminis f. sp. tritici]KAA1096901.1 hypothetical protein PGT21_031190 [Puccinia graminis f. sp. tritici]
MIGRLRYPPTVYHIPSMRSLFSDQRQQERYDLSKTTKHASKALGKHPFWLRSRTALDNHPIGISHYCLGNVVGNNHTNRSPECRLP